MDSWHRRHFDAFLTSFLYWNGWGNFELDPPLQILWEVAFACAEHQSDLHLESVREHIEDTLLRAGHDPTDAQRTAREVIEIVGAIYKGTRHRLNRFHRLDHALERAPHPACSPGTDARFKQPPKLYTWDRGRVRTYLCATKSEMDQLDGGDHFFLAAIERYLHRSRGPALESMWDSRKGVLQDSVWYRHGRVHRKNKPAMIFRTPDGAVRRETWFLEGFRHRTDGPAEVWLPPSWENNRSPPPENYVYGWYVHGREMTFDMYYHQSPTEVRAKLDRQIDHYRAAGSYYEGDETRHMPGYTSLFISYGGPDGQFAGMLNSALRAAGVNTWFFGVDARPGDKLHRVMHDGVNNHERVLLICSRHSLGRAGVLNELERVFEREAREGGSDILIPVRVDDYVLQDWAPKRRDVAMQVRSRVIADFTNPADFDQQFQRLVRTLATP